MRSIVVLADGTWETVSYDNWIMEVTEGEYEDLIAEDAEASDFPDNNMVDLTALIECWNTHNPTRKLPLAAE